jgi:hypothetical protein
MAVLSSREILPRSFSQRFGEPPSAERRFAVTLDGPTPTQTILNAVGIAIGSPHPEFPFLGVTERQFTEQDRQHAQVTYQYGTIDEDEDNQNPLQRPDIWSFSVGGASVPATYWLDANNQRRPLVNSAGDLIEGQTTEESEIRATITGNRPQFPLALASFVANTVNANPYLGGQPFTWKCAGISGSQQFEVVNDIPVRFYQISSELVYRASGWQLVVPDVGFNYIEDEVKKRCTVEMPGGGGGCDNNQIPTANAVPLAPDGSMMPTRIDAGLLVRRVHRAVDFSAYFGTPGF